MSEPDPTPDNDVTRRIDATELPEEEKLDLAERFIDGEGGVNDILELRGDTLLDDVDSRTFTTDLHGESLADALGRAYSLRDSIESQTGMSVSCEPTGLSYDFPSTVFYEIEITIEDK